MTLQVPGSRSCRSEFKITGLENVKMVGTTSSRGGVFAVRHNIRLRMTQMFNWTMDQPPPLS